MVGGFAFVIESPSLGLYYEARQQYELQSKPTNQFLRFDFPISAATKSKLSTTLRAELVDHEHYSARYDAKLSIGDYIDNFYNVERRHSHLKYLNPIESNCDPPKNGGTSHIFFLQRTSILDYGESAD